MRSDPLAQPPATAAPPAAAADAPATAAAESPSPAAEGAAADTYLSDESEEPVYEELTPEIQTEVDKYKNEVCRLPGKGRCRHEQGTTNNERRTTWETASTIHVFTSPTYSPLPCPCRAMIFSKSRSTKQRCRVTAKPSNCWRSAVSPVVVVLCFVVATLVRGKARGSILNAPHSDPHHDPKKTDW